MHSWFAFYSEQLMPNLPNQEILFGSECSRLPNLQHSTVSSQKSEADPGNDISTWQYLLRSSWKLSFCLLACSMGVAASNTYNIPKYEII